MSKKSMVIAGVAALVVVVVAVAVLMMSGKSLLPNTIFTGKGSSATSGTSSGSTSGTTSVSLSGSATKPNSTANTTPSTTTTGVMNSKQPAGALAPFPKLPDPGIPAQAPKAPVADGKTLAPLTSAPASTISGLAFGMVPEGSQYTIRMQPLGIGPDSFQGSGLVIFVDSAKPVGSAPENSKIVNENVLAIVDTTQGGTVTKGGTYTATLTFRSDGTKLLPILSQASVVK